MRPFQGAVGTVSARSKLMNYQDGLTLLSQEVTPEMRNGLSTQSVQQIGTSAILSATTPDRLQGNVASPH